MEKLPEGTQPQISVEELVAAELAVRNDERVQAYAAAVGKYSYSRIPRNNAMSMLMSNFQGLRKNKFIVMAGPLAMTIAFLKARECNKHYCSLASPNMRIYMRIQWYVSLLT